MRKNKLFLSLIALVLSFGFVSCTEDTIDNKPIQEVLPKGYFVLCEGIYGHNNSLDFYDSDSNKIILYI